jgi:hypothetical protein
VEGALRKKIIHIKETTLSGVVGVNGAIHYSYLLRLWQVHAYGENAWHILLENVQTGEKRGFASLEELFAYFDQVVEQENKVTDEVGDTELQG